MVLLNGKRRHRSAILVWFGGVTDGTQGPDISTIPAIALRQVEVLRDGASAQYGSDAIAGVMRSTRARTARATATPYSAAGNLGLPLGDTGFANLSFEYGNSGPTDRSVQRADAAALAAAGNTAVADPAQPWGDPTSEDDLKLFGNFGHRHELREPDDDRWTVGGALRVERFDVFGATANGKLSARYALAGAVSVRGGVSTGFRAPTPGQQNTFNVQSTIDPTTLDLVDSATVPSTFRAAQLRGGRPLDPETSVNATAGVAVDTGPFTLTADYFQVDVGNRLALSQNFTLGADERAQLLSEGIASALTLAFFRFFINDFSTRTRGVDVVSTWTPPGLGGATVFSFAMNHTDTEVTEDSDLLGPGDVRAIERGVPETRWNVAVNQRAGRVGLLGRLHYYGSWVDHIDARSALGADAPVLGGRFILDLEASVPLAAGATLAVGGENVFDTCSDRMDLFAARFGLPYSQFTPWGMSGGYYYARLGYRWGG